MNRNKLKIIACLSMLIDHVGYILFPQCMILRYIGRLAFPLFAFFIGEGCIYTSNRKKYFLSVLILGAGCQTVFAAEELITSGFTGLTSGIWYFNILFTFALSIPACFRLHDIINAKKKSGTDYTRSIIIFILYMAALITLTAVFYKLRLGGASTKIDYGICGILLPLSVVLFKEKKLKITAFSLMTLIYCFVFMAQTPYVWFSLAVIPLLIIYNGESGSKKFKYLFYIFYPAHLAVIYLINLMIN